MDKEHIVYKYTSPNGKVYIGICSKSRERKRKTRHKYDALTKSSNLIFHKAIRKYGWDSFEYEVLCYVGSRKTAMLMEKTLIKQFKSNDSKFGYNMTDGGDGGLGRIVSELERKSMSERFKGKAKSKEHCVKNGIVHSKKISQYDLNGNYIRSWNSASEVKKELGIDNGDISKMCRNKPKKGYMQKSVGGFIWKYYENEDLGEYNG